jgi:ribosomal-protein-alanine N-acetyltransferase
MSSVSAGIGGLRRLRGMRARSDGTVPQIQHGSVFLRPAEKDDVELFVRWLNDWRTGRTLGMRAPLSKGMEDKWVERLIETQGKEGYHFVICRLEDDRPVGTIGIKDLNLVDGSGGLGISVGAEEDRGRGYGSDALRALLRFAFDELRLVRVWLDVYDMNEGAQRVYERVGFVREGILRRAAYREGMHHDVHRMAVLADEWRAAMASEAVASEAVAAPGLTPAGDALAADAIG